MLDCKGNKIFEGDIVTSFLDDKHDPAFGVIKYGRYYNNITSRKGFIHRSLSKYKKGKYIKKFML